LERDEEEIVDRLEGLKNERLIEVRKRKGEERQ